MSALGSLVVKLALDHAEYTQGLDRTSQEALKFAKRTQDNFDQAASSTKEFLGSVALNVAGAITSVVGLNAAFTQTNQSINVLARLDDAAQKTGSTIQDLSRIQQVARNFGDAFDPIEQGITRLAKGIAQIDDPSSDAIRALNAIGVSARDSNSQLRSSADVYIDVAKSLQNYKDGAEKTVVANALFGKSGADLLPVLNNLAQGIDHVSGVSDKATRDADEFNNAVARSKAQVSGFFMSLATELLPTLNNIASAINQSSSQFNNFSVVSGAASAVLKGLAIAAFTVVDTFGGMGREIGASAAQLAALARMDFSGAKFIGQALAEDNIKSRAEYDKFVDTILNGEKRIEQAMDNGGSKKIIEFQANIPPAVDRTTRSIEKQTKAFDLELHKLKEYEAEAKRARDITESVSTKQERFNRALAELERLRPYLSVETYTRALEKAQRELQDTASVSKTVVTQMDQQWIQAGRNIQSILGNSIFDFFNDGLDGMWRNAKSAVGRILSEFAALRISQGIGLSAMFGIPAAASASSGIGGTGLGALNIAGMGTSAMSFIKSGFGIPSFLGSAGSTLPGAAGAFFSGMGGTGAAAAQGASALWGTSGLTGANAMGAAAGSAMAAAAGPLLVAYLGTQVFRSLAGDKRLGGGFGKAMNFVGDLPIIGDFIPIIPIINGLFGRGPLKQKNTSLTGALGADGFTSGALQTDFVAKGGLFRSNKNDFTRVDAVTGAVTTDNSKLQSFADELGKVSRDVIGLIGDTTKQVSGSLRQIGKDLGLSTSGLDSFNHQINLVSEKGKMLTEEQISKEIELITDRLAHSLLPSLDTFAQRGETAMQTISRLGAEFSALTVGAQNLGASAVFANQLIKDMSFESRSAIVGMAGGIEALSNKTAFFSQNFLSDSERLAPVITLVSDEMSKLGFASVATKDQFKSLVQSLEIPAETRNALLDLAPAFLQVANAAELAARTAQESAKAQEDAARSDRIKAVGDAFGVLQKSVEARRADITKKHADELGVLNIQIQNVGDSISRLKSFSSSLRDTINNINPLSRDAAKEQISAAIKSGQFDSDKLKFAIEALTDQSTDGFSSNFEFVRAQAESVSLLTDLGDAADLQLSDQEKMLKELDAQRRTLDSGFEQEILKLDEILIKAQTQVDALNSINNSVLSLTAAIGQFNLRSVQAGGGASVIDPISNRADIGGNPNITNKQIVDFSTAPGRTDVEIYNTAKKYGVSFAQYASATGAKLEDLYKWADSRGLPRFADGGMHRGGLRIVGERGPELEATGPSRITSTEKLMKEFSNREVVVELKKLREALGQNTRFNKKVSRNIDAVTQGGSSLRTEEQSA